MPSYNYARYLQCAIDGVLNQTHTNLELIVTDDCSKDESVRIAQEAARRDPRVVLVKHKENRGLSATRNSCIEASTGDFIALCDADDVWLPDKLAVQLQRFQGEPNLGLVHSDAALIDSAGNTTGGRFSEAFHTERQATAGNLLIPLCRRNFICVPSVLMRREALEYAGRFNVSLRALEDWVCWALIARRYTIDYIGDCLVHYRVHGGSLSHDPVGMAHNRVIALQILTRAIADIPESLRAEMMYHLGVSYMEIGNVSGALSAFAKSLKGDMFRVKSWARVIETVVRCGRPGVVRVRPGRDRK